MCAQNPSVVFCLCRPDALLLCTTCMHEHCRQMPAAIHDFSPVSDLPFAAQISYTAYKQRKVAIAQAMVLIEVLEKQESEDYGQVRSTFNDLFQQINLLIDSLHATVYRSLQEIRTILGSSLHTQHNSDLVDYILCHGQSLLTTKADLFALPVLTTLTNSKTTIETTIASFSTMDVYEYVLSKLIDAQRMNALQAGGEASEGLYCPVVMGNILRKYYGGDQARLGLIELTMAPEVDQESAFTFLDNGNIFCCGGSMHAQAAYILGASNGQVTVLPKLVSGRCYPGLICLDDNPYVFGGSGEAGLLTSCERFSAMERWEELEARMNRPRGAFTPCRYGKTIYLPGGLSTNTIEAFDSIRTSFHLLAVTLPAEGKSISYLADNKICVLLCGSLCQIDLASDTKEVKKTSSRLEIWSPSTPVLVGSKVLFWCKEDSSMVGIFKRLGGRRDGICFSFDMQKRDLKEEERFEYSTT